MSYRRRHNLNLSGLWLLIGVNVLMFIATTADHDLIYSLGLQPESFSERPWTIASSLFVHGSVWHILANMFTLYFFGSYLTLLVGERRFLMVYFLGGLVGNALYLLLADPLFTGIGASGAVFAVGGALSVMRPKLKVIVFPIPIPLPLWIAVVGGCLIISLFPHVAWQAHFGGLLLGLGVGYYFNRRLGRFYRF